MEIIMHFSKETKNKYVYSNDAPNAAVSAIYVQKEAVPSKPNAITITITITAGVGK